MGSNSRVSGGLVSALVALALLIGGRSCIDPEYLLERRIDSFPKIVERTLEHVLKVKDRPVREDVTFWCVNRNNSEFVQVFLKDPEETLRTKLDLTQSIAFVIHGWTDGYRRTWVRSLADSYLRFVGGNLCVVDWSRLALAEYGVAAYKTETVGIYLGKFIKRLMSKEQYPIGSVFLIGHSMGAHIAGFAGAYLKGKIPILIGLDPAGPWFTKYPLQPITKRLDPSDAKFIQNIHTDRYIIGADMNLGHTDFYPSGGATPQPGCNIPILENSRTYLQFTCSHYKAVDYFIDSLNPENKYHGEKTYVYKQLKRGTTFLDRYFSRQIPLP